MGAPETQLTDDYCKYIRHVLENSIILDTPNCDDDLNPADANFANQFLLSNNVAVSQKKIEDFVFKSVEDLTLGILNSNLEFKLLTDNYCKKISGENEYSAFYNNKWGGEVLRIYNFEKKTDVKYLFNTDLMSKDFTSRLPSSSVYRSFDADCGVNDYKCKDIFRPLVDPGLDENLNRFFPYQRATSFLTLANEDLSERCVANNNPDNYFLNLNDISKGGLDAMKVRCIRNGFSANPAQCCLQDVGKNITNKKTPACFTKDTYGNVSTCHPIYRDATGPGCSPYIDKICLGYTDELAMGGNTTTGYTNWKDLWTKNAYDNTKLDTDTLKIPCVRIMYRLMTSGDKNNPGYDVSQDVDQFSNLPSGIISPEGYFRATQIVEKALQKYIDESTNHDKNNLLRASDSDSTQDGLFTEIIWKLCYSNPGLCSSKLKELCQDVKSEDIANNPTMAKWCGCYMSDSEYDKYVNDYKINKECTPFCNRPEAIPLVDQNGIDVLDCKQSVCVMDDITLKFVDTKFNGAINFSQLCNSCSQGNITQTNNIDITNNQNPPSKHQEYDKKTAEKEYDPFGVDFGRGSVDDHVSNTLNQNINTRVKSSTTNEIKSQCVCYMENTTIKSVNAKLGNVNVGQNCGKTNCLIKDKNGNYISTDCNSTNSVISSNNAYVDQAVVNEKAKENRERLIKYSILILGLVILAGLLWFFFPPKIINMYGWKEKIFKDQDSLNRYKHSVQKSLKKK